MRPRSKTLALLLLLLPAGSGLAASAGYLTEPAEGDALEIALGHVREHHQQLGLTAADVDGLEVRDHYVSHHNGTTHVYLRQRFGGIEVVNGGLAVHVTRDGRILQLVNQLVPDLAGRAAGQAPLVAAENAVVRAAEALGLRISEPVALVENLGGPAQEARFTDGGISQAEIPVRLVWEKVHGGAVRLAWNVNVRTLDGDHWWDLRVDAESGDALGGHDWVASDSYRVFPWPFRNPDDAGGHTIDTDPADPAASPFGWHDDNGVAGNEYTDTRGNNVWAQEDTDANNSGGFRPPATATEPMLEFDYAWDPMLAPTSGTNQHAAIVNLFYWNNVIHDIMAYYGFDEASGNFQTTNYSGMGLGGDPVQADAQDGSGTNNANFGTPPDGTDPRMQMFQWTYPFPNELTITAPAAIVGDYIMSGANFGPPFSTVGITGDIALVDDGTATTTDACEPITNGGAVSGKIALIDRGNCTFVIKVGNAQAVGAIAVIVVNHLGDIPTTLGGTDPSITIPSGMIGMADGDLIKAQLGGTVSGNAHNIGAGAPPNRDSDLDNEVIVHEYGHGISNRLTGGPSNSGCLQNQEQAGEGWSDFFALSLTSRAGDTGDQLRSIANYVDFTPEGVGIRTQPYTTDTAQNTHTYAAIGGLSVPHGVGEVWASTVWDMYWALVDAYGYDGDLYSGVYGNNMAIQLVVDGLKLQPCSPDFLDARDGILQADLNNNARANECLIWSVFAARGMGVSADAGSNFAVGDETEAFDTPAGCSNDLIYTNGFESGNVNDWSDSLDANGDMQVNGAAAMVGALGLQIDINDADRVWVEDQTSSNENRYRGRFYFDPNTLTMADGTRQRIFQLFSDTPDTKRVVTGVLRLQGGTYKLLIKVRLDDGTKEKTGFVDIVDGPQYIELDWVRSSGTDNGSLRMFLDGVPAGNVLTGLDNDVWSGDRFRLGVVSQPKPTTSGTLFFDALEAHRYTPVWEAAP